MFPLLLTASTFGPVEAQVCVARLGDDSYFVREAAARRLEVIGPPALEALKGALGDGDRERMRRAERVLAAIRRRAAEPTQAAVIPAGARGPTPAQTTAGPARRKPSPVIP
jgi:hypothetical protein